MIYIEVLSRSWNPGKLLFKKNGLTEEDLYNFHVWLSREYVKLIVKAINDQRYRSKFPALTASYLNFKKKFGYSTGMWEMTGELKTKLTCKKKDGNTIVIGFPKKKHSDTNLTYLELAKILEFGTIRIPPRPLFRYMTKYVSSNIHYFYRKYTKEVK